MTELGADYFQYDEARHELRGERTGIRYQLTDRVTVQVSRVDLDARKIDLRLVTEPGIHTLLKNEARRADNAQQARAAKAGKPGAAGKPLAGKPAAGGKAAPAAASKTSKTGKTAKPTHAQHTNSGGKPELEKKRAAKGFSRPSKKKR